MRPKASQEAAPHFDGLYSSTMLRAFDLLKKHGRSPGEDVEMLACAFTAYEVMVEAQRKESFRMDTLSIIAECFLSLGWLDQAAAYAERCGGLGSGSCNQVPAGEVDHLRARIAWAQGNRQEALGILEAGLAGLGDLPVMPADFDPDPDRHWVVPVTEVDRRFWWTQSLGLETAARVRSAEELETLRQSLEAGDPAPDWWRRFPAEETAKDQTPVRIVSVRYQEAGKEIFDRGVSAAGTITSFAQAENPSDAEHTVYTLGYTFAWDGRDIVDELVFSVNAYHIELGMAVHDREDFEAALQPGQPVAVLVLPEPPYPNAVTLGPLADEVLRCDAVWR